MDTKPLLASRIWRAGFWLTLLLFLLVFLYGVSILISTLSGGVVV